MYVQCMCIHLYVCICVYLSISVVLTNTLSLLVAGISGISYKHIWKFLVSIPKKSDKFCAPYFVRNIFKNTVT